MSKKLKTPKVELSPEDKQRMNNKAYYETNKNKLKEKRDDKQDVLKKKREENKQYYKEYYQINKDKYREQNKKQYQKIKEMKQQLKSIKVV